MTRLSVSGLDRGSSEIDWCESNYTILPFVAEFWNAASNVLFVFVPPIMMYLSRPYARLLGRGVYVVCSLQMAVGLGSVYYHCTLSLVGQLIDENAILWVVMIAFGLWYPKIYMPVMLHKSRDHCLVFMLSLALVTSCLSLVSPSVNCIALFGLGVPATALLIVLTKRCACPTVYNLGVRCGIYWFFAMASWISDRFFCQFWHAIHFPYMHSVWHILIYIASTLGVMLLMYTDAKEEVPEANPRLSFWPGDEYSLLGVPYISFHPLESAKQQFC